MEAHGGYLSLYEDVDVAWLQRVAREALRESGQTTTDVALQVTVLGGPRVVRYAWDGAFTYGRRGAAWYQQHHGLAQRLSANLGTTVHAYAFDPDAFEQVVSYGSGRRVGGELLEYDQVELPDDDDDDSSFERLRQRWPLGHLARVLGIDREDLVRLPRHPMALIELEPPLASKPLCQLLPEELRRRRTHELFIGSGVGHGLDQHTLRSA